MCEIKSEQKASVASLTIQVQIFDYLRPRMVRTRDISPHHDGKTKSYSQHLAPRTQLEEVLVLLVAFVLSSHRTTMATMPKQFSVVTESAI